MSGRRRPPRPLPRPRGEPLSTYRYRAIVNGDAVTIRPRATKLILGGPAGHLFAKPERAGVAVADIDLHDLGGEFESMFTMRTHASDEAAERRLIEWAAEVGHRRIWIRDEVLDLAEQLHIATPVANSALA